MIKQKRYGTKYFDSHVFALDEKPGSISFHIAAVSNAISKPDSYQFQNALSNFKSFVASKFKIAQDMNDEQHFFNELFSSVSFQSVGQNSLLCISLLSELTSIDIGDKIIKANRIGEDLLSIPPITHPTFWLKFKRIVLWLQRTLGSFFQYIINPLNEKIRDWSEEEADSEKMISALKLMALFFESFPNFIVGTNRDADLCIDIILKGFLDMNTNVRYAAQQTLKTALTTGVNLDASVLCSYFMDIYYNNEYDFYHGISEALNIIIALKPEYIKYLKFESIPYKTMLSYVSNMRLAAFYSMPIALKTTPELFTEDMMVTILNNFNRLLQTKNANRAECLICCGDLIYIKKGVFTEKELEAINQVYNSLLSTCDSEQAAYALISFITALPDHFTDAMNVVFTMPLGDYIITAFSKLIDMYPNFATRVYNYIIKTVSPHLLSKETQPYQITISFKALLNLKVPISYVSEQLCLHFSLFMSHKDKDAKKAAQNYVLWYQNNSDSPEILQRILAVILTETNQAMRINMITNIKRRPCTDSIVYLLQTLIRDHSIEVCKNALKFMAKFADNNVVFSILNHFLNENLNILQNSPALVKKSLIPFLVISVRARKSKKSNWKSAQKLLAPYRGSIMKLLLSKKHQHMPKIALELISNLLINTKIDEAQLNELANQITTNLSIQLNMTRIKIALKLLIRALDYTDIIIKHNNELLLSILILTRNNSDDRFKETVTHILSRLGASKPILIKAKNIRKQIISPNIFITQSDQNDPVAVLQFTCAGVSLMTLLDILSEDSLSQLHQLAIDALVKIMKSNRQLGSFIETKLVNRYIEMLKSDTHSVLLLSSIQTLQSSVSHQSFAPLIPYLIDTICKKWDTTEHTMLEQIATWIFHSAPEDMKPFLPRLVTTFLSDLSSIESILPTLVNFGTAISSVVHIAYPIILEWIENNSDKIKTSEKVLEKFKLLIKNGGSQKYSVLILNTLTDAAKMNPALKNAALEVIYIVAVQMKGYFLLHIPFLSETFDFSKHKKLSEFILCIENNLPIPDEIINDVMPSPDPIPFPKTQPPSQKYKPINLTVPEPDYQADDWNYWFDELCQSVFTESSSRAVSACFGIASRYSPLHYAMFPLAFMLIVVQNPDDNAKKIIQEVISSETAPREIKEYFLSVIEINEILELECPVSSEIIAKNCLLTKRHAQAMRESEKLFVEGDMSIAPQLAHLYMTLDLDHAAKGVLNMMKDNSSEMEILSSWKDSQKDYKDIKDGVTSLKDDETQRSINKVFIEGEKKFPQSFNVKEMIGKKYKNESKFITAIYHLSKHEYDRVNECLKEMRKPFINSLLPSIYFNYKRSYNDFLSLELIGEIEETMNAMKTNSSERLDKISDFKLSIMNCDSYALLNRIIVRMVNCKPHESNKIILRYINACISEHKFDAAESCLMSIGNSPDDKDSNIDMLRCKLEWERGNRTKATDDMMKIAKTLEAKKIVIQWLIDIDNMEEAKGLLQSTVEEYRKDQEIWHQLTRVHFFLFEKTNNYNFVIESFISALNGLSLGTNLSLSIRVIQILFQHCSEKILDILDSKIASTPNDVWINVLPQIIGISASNQERLAHILQKLIYTVGCTHPQPVLYSLMVPLKSDSKVRKRIANDISGKLSKIYPAAVKSTRVLASELMRVAASWFEISYSILGEVLTSPKERMFSTFLPLCEIISQPPETFMETTFIRQVGKEMELAKGWANEYNETGKMEAYNQAIKQIADIWRKIKPMLDDMMSFKISDVSPQLSSNDSVKDLSVPGTFKCGEEIVYIQSFSEVLDVMISKQRPRKISIFGSNGVEYQFLLKAHEDTRLDERVMQLFNCINSFSKKDNLKLTTYSVTPLTANVGLIGWVSHCQTLFELIVKHRNRSSVQPSTEYDGTLKSANVESFKDFCDLPLESRVEAFKEGIEMTKGDDLQKVLLLQSSSSEDWAQHRYMYSSSLAVTSMIGYIIGIGDRHLNNIMLNRRDARLVHIDFGDCFEVRMHDKIFPELVPFRLTRMLTNALEAKSIEGTFRYTCEEIMRIVQNKGDQIIALLEVFIHDPLLQWIDQNSDNSFSPESSPKKPAVMTVNRIRDKLERTDIGDKKLPLEEQVNALIQQATDPKNLCQMFEGWYPWW